MPTCFWAARSCSSLFVAMTASMRGASARLNGVMAPAALSSPAATAASGLASAGAPAIPSANSRDRVSWPAASTSRLSLKCRKNVLRVSPARSAICATVVSS